MIKPSREQEEWFWKECEWKKIVNYENPWFYKSMAHTTSWWEAPDGMKRLELPAINIWALPYLFIYAVPLLEQKLGYKEAYKLLIRWLAEIMDGKDPALTLFWAMFTALGGK